MELMTELIIFYGFFVFFFKLMEAIRIFGEAVGLYIKKKK